MLAAASRGGVIPIFIRDASTNALGAAPAWRLGLGIAHLQSTLTEMGSQLVLRSGDALSVLRQLIRETQADAVFWSRLYDPSAIERDAQIKSALQAEGITAQSFGGHLLFEPWTVQNKTGQYYRVYTPFWKAVRAREVEPPRAAPKLTALNHWPASEDLADWRLGAQMQRGAPVLRAFVQPGEQSAQQRLDHFIQNRVEHYEKDRNLPAENATSGLSEYLSLGEISPHQCWHAGMAAMQEGKAGAETFLKELVWREFSYHLMYHTPHILERNWKPEWDRFAWGTDEEAPEVLAWKQGRTGLRFVDAAMREMYLTGRMHNRGRMIVASYLTKHLLRHWKIGLKWFEQCLVDWDPAANAMGWQWAAGSGPDAAPYFRIFNPVTQLEKFDPRHDYANRWIAEITRTPAPDALRYFEAIPRAWKLAPDMPYPAPIVDAATGRAQALAAYSAFKG